MLHGLSSSRFADHRVTHSLWAMQSGTFEKAITSMNFSITQASWFIEVWLSPALGFDYGNATARIYGPGMSPISWVSFRDVAEICSLALRHPTAERQTIEFGGPEALSPLEVVARFEKSFEGRSSSTMFLNEPCARSLMKRRIRCKRPLQP